MSFIKRIYKAFMHGPIYIILFGLIFYGTAAGLSYKQRSLEKEGIQAQGKVVSLVQNCDDDGCTYAPVTRFTTENGQSISFQSSYYSSPPAYDVGESVVVVYSPENPEKAVIKGEGWVLRIIFMILGGVVIAFGFGFFGTNIKNSYLEPDDWKTAKPLV